MSKWTREQILILIDKRPDFVGRSLVKIWERQTEDEQADKATSHRNGVGFSGAHAEFGSALAEGFQKYGRLTEKQLPYARKIVKRYIRQILEIANANG